MPMLFSIKFFILNLPPVIGACSMERFKDCLSVPACLAVPFMDRLLLIALLGPMTGLSSLLSLVYYYYYLFYDLLIRLFLMI